MTLRAILAGDGTSVRLRRQTTDPECWCRDCKGMGRSKEGSPLDEVMVDQIGLRRTVLCYHGPEIAAKTWKEKVVEFTPLPTSKEGLYIKHDVLPVLHCWWLSGSALRCRKPWRRCW